jgi:polyisoprenoid-binding protein YceI
MNNASVNKESAMKTATSTELRTFTIDRAHSEVTFQVRHLVTKVRGGFADFDGVISVDEEQPGRSSVSFTIQAASIDTNNADRDAHLRSQDFFLVEQFPTITFVSRLIKPVGNDEFSVEGDLTIRGVTRPLTLPVSFLGKAKDPWGNEKMGFESEVAINRKDFGLTWNAALEAGGFLVGDEVRISVSLQAASK